MKLGIPLLITLASVQIASAASYTAYSDTTTAVSTVTGYSVDQFNPSLGTLTGVEVTVPISTLVGTATVVNPTNQSVTVNNFNSYYDVWGSSGSLGYTEQTPSIVSNHSGGIGVVTSPDRTTTIIGPSQYLPNPPFEQQVFSITAGQSYPITPENISSSYFSAYKGNGKVTFDITNLFSITTTGSSYSVSTDAAGASSQVAVTYTYTPALTAVPEPSTTLALGLLVMSGLSMRTRRRA